MSQKVWVIEFKRKDAWYLASRIVFLDKVEAREHCLDGERVVEYRRVEKEDRKP